MTGMIDALPFDSESTNPRHAGSASAHLLDELAASMAIAPSTTIPIHVPCPRPTRHCSHWNPSSKPSPASLRNTRLEADLPDLLWSLVNLFHRKADRISRDQGDNEVAQRRSQTEQDGSEIRSVDLERLIAQGITLVERRNAFEFFRVNRYEKDGATVYTVDLVANEFSRLAKASEDAGESE